MVYARMALIDLNKLNRKCYFAISCTKESDSLGVRSSQVVQNRIEEPSVMLSERIEQNVIYGRMITR